MTETDEIEYDGETFRDIGTDLFVSRSGRFIRRTSNGFRALKPNWNGAGCMQLRWGYRGGRYQASAAHLVLSAYCRPPVAGEVVRFLDGDPTNTRLENLRWGRRSEK